MTLHKHSITARDHGTRLWRVTLDPSEMFLNRVFRRTDLNCGGFDEGTIFTHVRSGQKMVVGADGFPRKLPEKKTFAKPTLKTGGASANP